MLSSENRLSKTSKEESRSRGDVERPVERFSNGGQGREWTTAGSMVKILVV